MAEFEFVEVEEAGEDERGAGSVADLGEYIAVSTSSDG